MNFKNEIFKRNQSFAIFFLECTSEDNLHFKYYESPKSNQNKTNFHWQIFLIISKDAYVSSYGIRTVKYSKK